MKIIYKIIFLLFLTTVNCQTFNYDSFRKQEVNRIFQKKISSESLENFELKGKVKEVKVIEFCSLAHNTAANIKKIKTIRTFNPSGMLTYYGSIDEKGKQRTYNTFSYDNFGNKIKSNDHFSNDIVEKFIYDKRNNLTEHWIKSKHQKDFFIKEKYIYNDQNQLIKEYNLNNQIEIYTLKSCNGGFHDYDYISTYHYNNEKQLIEKTDFKYEYEIILNESPEEKYFLKNNKTEYFYENKKLIKEIFTGNDWLDNNTTKITEYKYDDNLLIEKKEINPIEINPYFFIEKYNYTNHNLSLFEIVVFENSKEHSFQKYYFKNNTITKYEHLKDEKVTEYNLYDVFGNLIEESNEEHTFTYKLDYDSNDNWIKYNKYYKGELIDCIEIEISYF